MRQFLIEEELKGFQDWVERKNKYSCDAEEYATEFLHKKFEPLNLPKTETKPEVRPSFIEYKGWKNGYWHLQDENGNTLKSGIRKKRNILEEYKAKAKKISKGKYKLVY